MKIRGRVPGSRSWGFDHPPDGRGLGRIKQTSKATPVTTLTSNVPATFSGAWFPVPGGELGGWASMGWWNRRWAACSVVRSHRRDGTKVAGGGAAARSVGRSVGRFETRPFDREGDGRSMGSCDSGGVPVDYLLCGGERARRWREVWRIAGAPG